MASVAALASPPIRVIESGRHIYRQGDSAGPALVLVRGAAKLSVVHHDGRQAVVAVIGPGQLFGEEGLAGLQTRRATATALAHCAMHEASTDTSEDILKLINMLADRTHRASRALGRALLSGARARLAAAICDLQARGIFEQVPIRQEDLAQMAGISREHANRLFGEFVSQGMIAARGRGRYRATNLDALRRLAGGSSEL